MNEFNSVEEFLDQADLNEKIGPGAERKGEFIAIYEGSENNSDQGTVSAELAESHGIDEFDFVSFTGDFGDEVHALFYTEDFLESRDDIEEKNAIRLSPSNNINFDFSAPSILKHLDLEAPVRFRVNNDGESNGEALRTGECVFISLSEVEF